jgi:hypothetical protein
LSMLILSNVWTAEGATRWRICTNGISDKVW